MHLLLAKCKMDQRIILRSFTKGFEILVHLVSESRKSNREMSWRITKNCFKAWRSSSDILTDWSDSVSWNKRWSLENCKKRPVRSVKHTNMHAQVRPPLALPNSHVAVWRPRSNDQIWSNLENMTITANLQAVSGPKHYHQNIQTLRIPKPNSALSSNRELAQAGPSPLLLVVYGKDGLEPPQIEEQPANWMGPKVRGSKQKKERT